MKRSVVLSLSLFFLLFQSVNGQTIFPTQSFVEEVGYLKVSVVGLEESYRFYPYVYWDSGERVRIDFDLLEDVPRTLYYTLEHCSSEWLPTDINPIESHSGNPSAQVLESIPSRGTRVSYRSYSIMIGEEMAPQLSGNWLVKVFDQRNEENPILQAAFAICEREVDVRGDVSYKTPKGNYTQFQNVEVFLSSGEYNFSKEAHKHIVTIGQNGSSYRYQTLQFPGAVYANSWEFSYDHGALFPAGNEFFAWEILSDKYNGMGVEKSWVDQGKRYLHLYPNRISSSHPYVERHDVNGRRLVRNTDMPDWDSSTDYYEVEFTLYSSELSSLSSPFLEGEAFDFLPKDLREMRYDATLGAYIGSVLVKGGYVSYRYSDQESGENQVMGDYYQTENEYTIFCYRRRLGEKFDRLVGVGTCSSNTL